MADVNDLIRAFHGVRNRQPCYSSGNPAMSLRIEAGEPDALLIFLVTVADTCGIDLPEVCRRRPTLNQHRRFPAPAAS